ncbi:hypothetical protein [Helicobacter cinaedi]|nr:hypothetical protein [Helicobacter cinaedi]
MGFVGKLESRFSSKFRTLSFLQVWARASLVRAVGEKSFLILMF